MPTSLLAFRDEYIEALLRFLWRQWSQLGVFAEFKQADHWAIDPEALLLFTLEAGRYDPRLFDEVLDWLDTNGQWINIQRLRNLAKADPEYPLHLLTTVAGLMATRDPSAKWQTLAVLKTIKVPDIPEQEMLYLSRHGHAFPPPRQADRFFLERGYVRPPVEWRGLSRPVSTEAVASLCFKLRSVWGVTARADILLYLLLRGEGTVPEIAEVIHYSIPNVRGVLQEMVVSNLLQRSHHGREVRYHLPVQQWWRFLYPEERQIPVPTWRNWGTLFRSLLQILRWCRRTDLERLSPYLQVSEMRQLLEKTRDALQQSGLPVRPLPDILDTAESIMTWLSSSLQEVLPAVVPGTHMRRLEVDTRDAGLEGHRRYFLQAYPLQQVDIQDFDKMQEVLRQPRFIRRHGFGPMSEPPVLLPGGIWRGTALQYSALSLQRDGLLTWVETAGPEGLGWADQQHRGRIINQIALVESTFEFVRLFKERILPHFTPLPAGWRITGGMADMREGNDPSLLGTGAHPSLGMLHEAPANALEIKPMTFTTEGADEVAYEILQEIYYWFGIQASRIPLSEDRKISIAMIRQIDTPGRFDAQRDKAMDELVRFSEEQRLYREDS